MKIDGDKIRQAQGVLNALKRLSGKKTLWQYMFNNGREQGYILIDGSMDSLDKTRCVAFSEARSSDMIVVYAQVGYMNSVSDIADTTWKTAKYFDYQDYVGAAKYIRSFFERNI